MECESAPNEGLVDLLLEIAREDREFAEELLLELYGIDASSIIDLPESQSATTL